MKSNSAGSICTSIFNNFFFQSEKNAIIHDPALSFKEITAKDEEEAKLGARRLHESSLSIVELLVFKFH